MVDAARDETSRPRAAQIRGRRRDAGCERAAADARSGSRIAGDQSNSVAFVDDRYVLKLFRRIEPAPNPEFEIGRFLAAHGFTRTPALVGALEYDRAGARRRHAGGRAGRVKHQGSGWDFTIDELRRYYERVAARVISRSGRLRAHGRQPAISRRRSSPRSRTGISAAPRRWAGAPRNCISTLGADGQTRRSRPNRSTARTLDALADEMRGARRARRSTCWRSALDRCATRRGRTPRRVLAARDVAARALRAMSRGSTTPGMRIRVHGDYHLGQVLRTEEDFVILDFEGEPARIARRAARQAVAAQGRRRHAAIVQLRGLRRAVRVHRARAGRLRAARAVGRHLAALGVGGVPRRVSRGDRTMRRSCRRRDGFTRLLAASRSTRRCTSSRTN